MTDSTLSSTPSVQDILALFPGHWVQYLDDSPNKDRRLALGTPEFDLAEAQRKQKQGCGVFFCPNAFDGPRRLDNLVRIQSVFVDLDCRKQADGTSEEEFDERLSSGLDALRSFPLPPHLITRTRNGLHAIWRVQPLSKPEGLALFDRVEELLIRTFGADPAARDATRLLRLPGFLHLKEPDSPFSCHLLDADLTAKPYRLADLIATLESSTSSVVNAGSALPDATKPWEAALDGVAEGQRNQAAASVCGKLLSESSLELWETAGWGGLKQWNDRNEPPLPEAELRAVFDSIAARERHKREERSNQGNQDISRTPSEQLVRLATDSGAILFLDQFDEPHARIPTAGKRICKVRGKEFQQWLSRLLYDKHKKVASIEAVHSACTTLAGHARYSGLIHPLEQRVARHEGVIWYDLADESGRAVRITAEGWSVETEVPILFRRSVHQCPQVHPVRGRPLDALLGFVHFAHPEQGKLLLPYLVSCLIPDIPHPVALVTGPQGASKSTLCRFLRRLIDPTCLEGLSLPPRKEMPLVLFKHWYASFDNVGTIPADISNLLCRAVTGEGISRRQLFSDDEDVIFQFRRCLCLNGIHLSARPDLLDRALLFSMDRLPPERVRDESAVEAEFESLRPQLLGALFDALSGAMKVRPTLRFSRLPRMADFAVWGAAVAEAMGLGAMSFLEQYGENIQEQHEEAVTENPVALVLLEYMARRQDFCGTASQLLTELLASLKDDSKHRMRGLPRTASSLTRQLNLMRINLAQVGLQIDSQRSKHGRKLSIRKVKPASLVVGIERKDSEGDDIDPQMPSPVSGPAEANGRPDDGGDGTDSVATPTSHV